MKTCTCMRKCAQHGASLNSRAQSLVVGLIRSFLMAASFLQTPRGSLSSSALLRLRSSLVER